MVSRYFHVTLHTLQYAKFHFMNLNHMRMNSVLEVSGVCYNEEDARFLFGVTQEEFSGV